MSETPSPQDDAVSDPSAIAQIIQDVQAWVVPAWDALINWVDIAVIVTVLTVQGAWSSFQTDYPPPPVPFLVAQSEGDISFRSQSPYDFIDALGTDEKLEDVILGTLTFPTLPRNEATQLPAMILIHGSDGIHDDILDHAKRLRDLGVVTLVVDSFTTRGIGSAAEDQIRITEQTMMADAYAALDLLASHPHIDPARIGILGFSKGGTVAVYAASAKIRQLMARDTPEFAVHIALYPFCNVSVADPTTTGAPVYMLLGEKDDYTPARHCMTLQSEWNAAGGRISTSLYPGAAHKFDASEPVYYNPDAIKVVRDDCRLLVDEQGLTASPLTGMAVSTLWQRVEYLKQCGAIGASLGGDPDSARAAQREIALIVQQKLLMPR